MGAIQGAINQALGTIGIASRIGQNLRDNETRMTEAMKKVASKQEAQVKQRRNFMEYLRKMPTSFGGPVGELPSKTQKELAKQYTSRERQQIMNQMDKEAKRVNK